MTELFKAIAVIEEEARRHVETPQLNRALIRAINSYPPSFVHGKRFKILYAFQKPGRMPKFVLFVNDAGSLTPHYRRYLIDKIRASWGFTGCPVLLEFKQRERREFVGKPPKRRGFEKSFHAK